MGRFRWLNRFYSLTRVVSKGALGIQDPEVRNIGNGAGHVRWRRKNILNNLFGTLVFWEARRPSRTTRGEAEFGGFSKDLCFHQQHARSIDEAALNSDPTQSRTVLGVTKPLLLAPPIRKWYNKDPIQPCGHLVHLLGDGFSCRRPCCGPRAFSRSGNGTDRLCRRSLPLFSVVGYTRT